MPDRDVLEAKVESIARCLKRIQATVPPTAKDLAADYDAQDIISLNLQRAIQLSVDLAAHLISARGWAAPATMAETFETLAANNVIDPDVAERLRKAVGFRNISVHEYEKIDWNRVYTLVTERLEDFRRYVESIATEWHS